MSHHCHAIECSIDIPPRMLFCRQHWGGLTKSAQRAVWDSYEDGQEINKDFSGKYAVVQSIAVALAALDDGAWAKERADWHIEVTRERYSIPENVCQGLLRQMDYV